MKIPDSWIFPNGPTTGFGKFPPRIHVTSQYSKNNCGMFIVSSIQMGQGIDVPVLASYAEIH